MPRLFVLALILAACAALPGAALRAEVAVVQPDPQAMADRVMQALDLHALFPVMADEGAGYARDLEEQFLPEGRARGFQAELAAIHDPAGAEARFRRLLTGVLTDEGLDPAPVEAFFATHLGRDLVARELTARRGLLDETVRDEAQASAQRMEIESDPHLALIDRFIQVNQLEDMNVAAALNANTAFFQGLAKAKVPGAPVAEADILAEVAAQEPDIRTSTQDWLRAFGVLAYGSLSDADLQTYVDFCDSPAGRGLNRALFTAFDRLIAENSGQIGLIVGRHLAGTDL